MPASDASVLCSFIEIDVHRSLHQLMEEARVTWVSPKHKEKFLAHDWPTHHEEPVRMIDRCFALITDNDSGSARILHNAIRHGRYVCPATLHEALALATFFRTRVNKPHWTNHDFAVVGTRVHAGENTYIPTIAIREGELYLGVELFSPHDPPSYILVTY